MKPLRLRGAAIAATILLFGLLGCDDKPKRADRPANGDPAKVLAGEASRDSGAKAPPPTEPAKASKPSKLTPPGGRFAIAFPPGVVPATNDQKVKSAAGDMTTKVWMAQVGSGYYIVNYTDMPAELLAGGNAKTYLEGGRDGALRTFNATLIKEERYTVEGAPGIRFWYRGAAGGTTIYGRTDALFASPRIYQVQYLAETESEIGSAKVAEFFDSFALLGDVDFGPKLTTGPDGRFSIALPPSFPDTKTTRDMVDSPAGEIQLTMMTALTAKGAVSVGYSDIPGEGALGRSNLDGSRDAMLRESGAKLEREEDFAFKGRSARRVWFTGESQGQAYFGRADLIADGRRLYMVQAMTPSKVQLIDPQFEAFFSSFKLLDAGGTQK
ncbi:MAG: hypothetical protein ACI9MR_002635 [Myxococcota bacterium]|jgi:hypothetical protein